MKTKKMPMAAKRQKDLKAGNTVVAPMPKAIKSVILVMVIATPECLSVRPNRCTKGFAMSSGFLILAKLCTMTNMSSIPMPRQRNGRMAWTKVKG